MAVSVSLEVSARNHLNDSYYFKGENLQVTFVKNLTLTKTCYLREMLGKKHWFKKTLKQFVCSASNFLNLRLTSSLAYSKLFKSKN
ncbi:MAG: hypothetical protein AAF573_23025 [Bacteroidota bacterium]